MKPPVDAPTSRQRAPSTDNGERPERVLELLAATGDVARRPLHDELGVLVDLLARLVMPWNAPSEHECLRLRARLGEPALHEQDVEPLLHRGKGSSRARSSKPSGTDRASGDAALPAC